MGFELLEAKEANELTIKNRKKVKKERFHYIKSAIAEAVGEGYYQVGIELVDNDLLITFLEDYKKELEQKGYILYQYHEKVFINWEMK